MNYVQQIDTFFTDLMDYLYPVRMGRNPIGVPTKDKITASVKSILNNNIYATKNMEQVATDFINHLPKFKAGMDRDISCLYSGDPAAKNNEEIILSYPGFYAIAAHRIANHLIHADVELIPRMISEHAHSKTGIDIHPRATIGDGLCIDHGTGVVIGETTVIGNNVKIYQGVTLGALSIPDKNVPGKRHPTIEDGVILYAQATILGGKTTIGKNSIIGGNVWITSSVPPNTKVYYKPSNNISKSNEIKTKHSNGN